MRIRFKRSGGVAGNVNYSAPPLEVDSDELPAERAEELHKLVEEARPFDQPPREGARGATRDELGYELTVEDAGRSHTIRASDDDTSEGMTNLVGWLEEEHRARVGKELAARKKGGSKKR
jgi:hypothetical protein